MINTFKNTFKYYQSLTSSIFGNRLICVGDIIFRLIIFILPVTIISLFNSASLFKYKNPHFENGRSVIVHLFEWKWKDIGDECSRFLGPNGFGGIQISPPSENLIINVKDRPWWERYQPMSYKLITRSGNERDFAEMCRRCNAVGVRIYADVVLNHMTSNSKEDNVGTGGSIAEFKKWHYFGVPYEKKDFNHPICDIKDSKDPKVLRNCQLFSLKDLNQSSEYVRNKIVDYLNRMIDFGVAGFRIDAAKHMWPSDLKVIYDRLNDLNVNSGFPPESRPFIYQEVIVVEDDDTISTDEYTPLGRVTEFKFGLLLGDTVLNGKLSSLKTWGPKWGLMKSKDALVFVDNHDNQRGHGAGGATILTYKKKREYEMAVAFMLAHPYGEPRIMSSFHFVDTEKGPPMDRDKNIISPFINNDDSCGNGWVCEHRWPSIYRMVSFRNAVSGTTIINWWDNNFNQIAFCRVNKGFIVFNNELYVMNEIFQTCLPSGSYCDIITGIAKDKKCTGKVVNVDENGLANIKLDGYFFGDVAILAIHVGTDSKL